MADDNQTPVLETEQPIVDNQQQPEPTLDEMMRISLGLATPPEVKAPETTPQTTEPPVATTEPVKPDFFSSVKEYGIETPEQALEALKEYRSLKDKPQVFEPSFENEDSKTLFELIKAGKTNEVYEVLGKQQKINSLLSNDVSADNAGDIIKLSMQLKHKDLTPQEIDYKFNKQYSFPKEPVQDALSESDEDFKARHDAWQEQVNDAKMNMVIDAKLAKPDLAAAKAEIKLPELQQQVDEDYIQWKKSLEEEPQIAAEREAAYKALTAKNMATKLNFKDEANKINFDFQFEPDSEGYNSAVDMALDVSKFFNSFLKPDGTPDREGFLKAMYFAKNYETALIEAMKQAKNATIKSFLPDNSGSGSQRQFPQAQEASELDKMMQASLNGFMPRQRQQ